MSDLETFEAVVARFCPPDEQPDATTVSLSQCLRDSTDPRKLLGYLEEVLGSPVRRLEDLLRINDLTDEEELACQRVREGCLVTHASEGWFLLVTE